MSAHRILTGAPLLGLLLLVACGGGTEVAVLTLAVQEPAQALTVRPGESIEVQCLASIPATVSVYADRDGDLATTEDQTMIAEGREVPGGVPQSMDWDTTSFESGPYEIVVVATVRESEVVASAPGTVILNVAPTAQVDSLPEAEDTSVRWGTQVVTLTFTDDDPDDIALSSVYLDQDGDASTTADQIAISVDRADGDGSPQTVQWDTRDVAPGTYHYVVQVSDGVGEPIVAVSVGTLSVDMATEIALSEMAFVAGTDRKWDQKNDYVDDLAQGYIPAGGYMEIDLLDADPWGWYQEVLPLDDTVLRESDDLEHVLGVGLEPLTVYVYGAVWDYDNDYYAFYLEAGTTVSWVYSGALPVTSGLIPHPDQNPDGVVTPLGENHFRVETTGYYFYKQERRGYSPGDGTYDVPPGFPHFMCFRLDMYFNQE